MSAVPRKDENTRNNVGFAANLPRRNPFFGSISGTSGMSGITGVRNKKNEVTR